MRQYIQAIVYPDSGGYVAECAGLHAVTQGATLDEAVSNLREVVALALEDADVTELGLAPKPTILVNPGAGTAAPCRVGS